MGESKSVDVPKSKSLLGKVGLAIMVLGMVIVYADGLRMSSTVTIGYQFYEHPEIHIPIIGIIVAFSGTAVFTYNFRKGRNVI